MSNFEVGYWIFCCSSVSFLKQGGRAAIWRILIRSLARITIIDLFFIPFLGKPLHDWLSGTEVVES